VYASLELLVAERTW